MSRVWKLSLFLWNNRQIHFILIVKNFTFFLLYVATTLYTYFLLYFFQHLSCAYCHFYLLSSDGILLPLFFIILLLYIGYIEVVSFELLFFFPCRQAVDFKTRQLLLTTIECFFPLSYITSWTFSYERKEVHSVIVYAIIKLKWRNNNFYTIISFNELIKLTFTFLNIIWAVIMRKLVYWNYRDGATTPIKFITCFLINICLPNWNVFAFWSLNYI